MKKILIAEDDQFLSEAYLAKFKQINYEIDTAMDGEEVLTKLESFKPDLLVLDIVMPKLDGFSVLNEVRQNPNYKDLKIIVASNLGQKEDIDQAKSLGADDFIVKTDLSLDELLEKIENLL